jgi:hypothetical protein
MEQFGRTHKVCAISSSVGDTMLNVWPWANFAAMPKSELLAGWSFRSLEPLQACPSSRPYLIGVPGRGAALAAMRDLPNLADHRTGGLSVRA